MGFIESIKSCFSGEELPVEPIFRAVLFENVRSILHYEIEEIALSLKKGGLVIRGDNLYIKKYCAGDVVICGKIKSVERV